MTWVAVAVAGIGAATTIGVNASNQNKAKKKDKKAAKALAERPDYTIQPEAYTNQDIARNAAFGRDRSVMQQEDNIEQESADAIGQAQGVSSSTGSILSTLAAITSSKNQALRGLAGDEAMIQNQNRNDLFDANNAVIDEEDKAWNYNNNIPYQNAVAERRDRKKANTENIWKAADTAASFYAAYQNGNNSKSKTSFNNNSLESEFQQNGWK